MRPAKEGINECQPNQIPNRKERRGGNLKYELLISFPNNPITFAMHFGEGDVDGEVSSPPRISSAVKTAKLSNRIFDYSRV